MVQTVNLDAMILRADFAIKDEEEFALDLFQNFPLTNLDTHSPVLRLLRKPDFQRETNHWSPEQVVSLIESFLDNQLIPSLILWRSSSYIFVIDGGHRLSALRSWMEDDYGDGPHSAQFYRGEISKRQRQIGQRTRRLIEARVGKYLSLMKAADPNSHASEIEKRRARVLVTRGLSLQWVQGTAEIAESSFFKINSQGTPLDDTEEMLLKNRRRAIPIAARAVVRSAQGHKYWSAFAEDKRKDIEDESAKLYKLLFDPESTEPVKTLDLPLGGSQSPVDSLALLIEFFSITGGLKTALEAEPEDADGALTIAALRRAQQVVSRLTGNDSGSLGLHPAVYFYNEQGKFSRFFFLGMVNLVKQKLAANDKEFFKKFIKARQHLEEFLVSHKATLGLLLQNMAKRQRVQRISDVYNFLIEGFASGSRVKLEDVLAISGAKGKILDLGVPEAAREFSDGTKSQLFLKAALESAMRCSVCNGYLDPGKSVSYDHKVPKRDGGSGSVDNGQLLHPYCNQSVKQ